MITNTPIPSSTLTPAQMQANFTAMKGTSPATTSSASPTNSWDEFDKAVNAAPAGSVQDTANKDDAAIKSTLADVGGGIKTVAKDVAQSTSDAQQNALESAKNDVEAGRATVAKANTESGLTALKDQGKAFVQGGLGTTSDLINFLLAPLTGAVKGGIVDQNANALSETAPIKAIDNSGAGNAVQTAQQKLQELSQAHPTAFKGITDALNVTLTAAGGAEAPEAVAGLPESIASDASDLKSGLETAGDKTSEILNGPVAKATSALKNAGGDFLDGISRGTGEVAKDTSAGNVVKNTAENVFNKLDDKTKTALNDTPLDKFKSVVEEGRNAMTDDKILTPIENVGKNITQGLKTVAAKAERAAIDKGNLLYKSDLWTKPTGDIVKNAADSLDTKFTNIKLDSSDQEFLDNFKKELQTLGENPNLGEVDKTIDLLQDKIYKASGNLTLKTTNRLLGPLRSVLGELNTAAKEIGGPEYTRLIDESSRLIGLRNSLNRRLGTEGSTAGSFVKRLFSPSDADTKRLFAALEKETGGKYFRDARLAKFVMQTLGDTRINSLLEEAGEAGLSKIKMAKAVAKYVGKKTGVLKNPLETAADYVKQNEKIKANTKVTPTTSVDRSKSITRISPRASSAPNEPPFK